MNTFIHKTFLLHLWTLIFAVLKFKIIPDWYCYVLGFGKYFYRFWLQWFFKWFTAWNTRFNRKITIFVFLTCKVYIGFLPFVGGTTWTVWFMLFISRTQLLKNIIDSIQGLLLLLILLAQLDYFCSKNFKLILQKVSIWNIISPSILQVFREIRITLSVTYFT